MDTSKIPKQKSKEANSDGRPINLPGIYKHKDMGAVFITADGDEGVAQADALMSTVWKDAWERTGDVPSRLELLEMRKAQENKEAALIEGKKPSKAAVA
jgi:hypothetical protein